MVAHMSSLYLRNVPDEVVDRLKELARREGISVSALAIRDLTHSSLRVSNSAVLDALPDLGTDTDEIVDALHEGRAGR